jgi:two-component system, chemotaxis family, chemotaxis protein CheY
MTAHGTVPAHDHQNLTGTSILTVDDDQLMRSIVKGFLSQAGCRDILQARSGKEGLELFAGHRTDLVLCDWVMEPMNGLAFLTEMRQIDKESAVPVIMLTGNSEPADALSAQHLNIAAWLVKPIAFNRLIQRVGAVLSLPTQLFSIQDDLAVDRTQLAVQYWHKLTSEIAELQQIVASLQGENETQLGRHWSSLARIFHTVKGQAGTFDYELITKLADIGQTLLRQAADDVELTMKFRAELHRALSVLVTAMSLVLQGNIKGDGGPVGEKLLGKINETIGPIRALLAAELKNAGKK